MSKESFIGGDYIETTGGDNRTYAKGNIVNSSALQFLQKGHTSGVYYGTNKMAPTIHTNTLLKKFLVHFRRPSDYQGKYGFDWLREEYIFPLVKVAKDNNGNSINAPRPLCKNVNNLKQEYLNGVLNNISPYGIRYYPSWLSIFPNTTTKQFAHGSRMHASGVKLDLQFDELEQLLADGTEILLESSNKFLKISPTKIPIAEVINAGKKSRNINGKIINYYELNKKITVKCEGGTLNHHTEIKVFAKLDKEKVEVGKLMVYKNNIIPKAEIVVVNVISNSSSKASLRTDYQYLFKNQSFNQALIRAEVTVDTEFDLTKLAKNADIATFLTNAGTYSSARKLSDIISLYEKYGKFTVKGGINSNNTHRTYLFFTSLSSGGTRGICSLDQNTGVWGNSYIVFNIGLQNARTIVHECGHSFALPHIFEEAGNPPHPFYQGYTDAYMDYDWAQGGKANKYDGKMQSIFKWQWDIMRKDRSLIFNY